MVSQWTQARWLSETVGIFVTQDQVVRAVGDDARDWINGQVTADVRELTSETAVYALATNTKGRILGDLWVRRSGEDVALTLPELCAAATLESFEQHIIMEDVELSPQAELRVVTVQGPRSEQLLQGLAKRWDAHHAPRLGPGGLDLWVGSDDLVAALFDLRSQAEALGGGQVDAAAWEHARIALAVPRAGVDFGLDTYPQEAGLGQRAVSFQKGCYQGQEAVYMLEKRGKVARRLVQIAAPENREVRPGASLTALEDGAALGQVTSVAPGDATTSAPSLALGYVRRKAAEVGHEIACLGTPWRVQRVVGTTELDAGP